MEAVAALALACNITQIVEYAGKIVLLIRETHKTGASEENIVLEYTAKRLGDLSKTLSTSLNSTPNQLPITSVESELQARASEILKVAEELQSKLNDLKSKGGHRETLRKTYLTVRKKNDIDKLEKRLRDQEKLLDTGLLVRLRYVYILEATLLTIYLNLVCALRN
jgi:hypothetical protein